MFKKYRLTLLAANTPKIKKRITAKVVPLPLLNNEPINIKKKIKLDVKILKWIPITEPIIKKIIINIYSSFA